MMADDTVLDTRKPLCRSRLHPSGCLEIPSLMSCVVSLRRQRALVLYVAPVPRPSHVSPGAPRSFPSLPPGGGPRDHSDHPGPCYSLSLSVYSDFHSLFTRGPALFMTCWGSVSCGISGSSLTHCVFISPLGAPLAGPSPRPHSSGAQGREGLGLRTGALQAEETWGWEGAWPGEAEHRDPYLESGRGWGVRGVEGPCFLRGAFGRRPPRPRP